MEGIITAVVEQSKCRTSMRKNHGRKTRAGWRECLSTTTARPGAAIVQDSWSASQRNSNQGSGRTHADSRAVFASKRLKRHGPQYNNFPLLFNVTLERELRQRTPWLIIITIFGIEKILTYLLYQCMVSFFVVYSIIRLD